MLKKFHNIPGSAFPGQEIFVRLTNPEKDVQFFVQSAPWTNYRVTTRITTRVSTDVEKCQTVENNFDSLLRAYRQYGDCLTSKVFDGNRTLDDRFGARDIEDFFRGI